MDDFFEPEVLLKEYEYDDDISNNLGYESPHESVVGGDDVQLDEEVEVNNVPKRLPRHQRIKDGRVYQISHKDYLNKIM